MARKPYQSSLIPYGDEIIDLRSRRPPMPYQHIAELLGQKYNLSIRREAIFKFIKVRSRGRKAYVFRPDLVAKKSSSVAAAQKLASPSVRSSVLEVESSRQGSSNVKFQFTPSNRYNLTRLPPEEAAAIRKELEKNGH